MTTASSATGSDVVATLRSRVDRITPRTSTMQPGTWRDPGQTAASRGYGHRWRKFRTAYLSAHPLCVMCEAEGKTEAATVVDHVTPHRGDMVLFWQGPFQALCAAHHSRHKQRQEQGR